MLLLLTIKRDMMIDGVTKSMPVPVLVNIDAYDVIARLNEAATKIVGSVLYTKGTEIGPRYTVLETPVTIWGMIELREKRGRSRDIFIHECTPINLNVVHREYDKGYGGNWFTD